MEGIGGKGAGKPFRRRILHHCYDRIARIEYLSEEVPMYDIEVEGLHSFVANGFVCHNSQGSEYPAVVLALHTQHYMFCSAICSTRP